MAQTNASTRVKSRQYMTKEGEVLPAHQQWHESNGTYSTEDARFLPPGRELITGRAGDQAFWQSGFDQGACDVVLESLEIKSLADGVAYEIGRNIVRLQTIDGSHIDVLGKSLCIFRRESDGAWRADVDMFNAINS
jgi:ketosteroid isomerase-like protein